jgi:histidinol-phosphate/aromatic aminotransferase/cobyric acid decarboxylase-like protein
LVFVARLVATRAFELIYSKTNLLQMADGGVVTRFRGTETHCDECIRVTIGKPEENEAFLVKLQEMWTKLNP